MIPLIRKKQWALGLLLMETALYAAFLTLDVLGWGNTVPLKFTAILLVALAGLGAGREDRLVSLAFTLTLLADVFLLVLGRWYALGVALFLGVQGCYALRLARWRGRGAAQALRPRFALALPAALAAAPLGLPASLSAAYIFWFGVNVAEAVRLAREDRQGRSGRFALGLLLFFCCDLCVGACNAPAALLPTWLAAFAQVAMWGFYLPGQVLILSSTDALGGE